MRCFSISSSRKFRITGSASVTARSSPSFFSCGGEVGREEEDLQLARLVERVGERAELLAHRRRACPGPWRPRTASGRRPWRSLPSAPSSAESEAKSSSASASSTSRFWSSSVSDLRVTFSVASTVRSATSARISWIARRVSASMSRRVCSIISSRLRARLGDDLVLGGLAGLARAGDDLVRLTARLGEPLAVLGQHLRRPPCASARRRRSTPRSPSGACRAPRRCAGTRACRAGTSRSRRRAASRSSARRRARRGSCRPPPRPRRRSR